MKVSRHSICFFLLENARLILLFKGGMGQATLCLI